MTGEVASPPSSPDTLWHHRDFIRLWGGETVSQLGSALGGIALPYLAVTVLAATSFEMGILGTLQGVGFLVVGLPAGALIDRWRKRRVMLFANLGRAIALASLTIAWWLGAVTLAQLLIVATIVGGLTVFFDVAYQSYIPVLVGRDHIVEGNSKLQASQSVSQAAGPAIGGIAITFLGAANVIGMNAIGYVASAWALARIRHREASLDRSTRRRLRAEIAEGLSFVIRHPLLIRLVACTGIGNLAFSASSALVMLYMVRDLGLSAVQIGIIEAIGALGGLVGAVAAGPITRLAGEGPTIIVTATLLAACAFVYPVASLLPPFTTLIVGMGLLMASQVMYNIATVSFRQRLCPPQLLGRMNASTRFLIWGTIPFGAFTGGILGEHLGVVPTMWVTAIAGLAALVPVFISPFWTMRTLPTAH